MSLVANIEGDGGSEIAIGNIVGSNIGNLTLTLGVAGLLALIPVERGLLRREYPLLLATSAGFILMSWNGEISRWEGAILLAGLLLFSYYTYKSVQSSQHLHARRIPRRGGVDRRRHRASRAVTCCATRSSCWQDSWRSSSAPNSSSNRLNLSHVRWA